MTEPKINTDGTFQRFWDRHTASASEGGQGGVIRRREVTFTLPKDLCEPGAFDADLEVTLTGLTSQDELDALKSASGEAMGFMMAKRAIKSVGGHCPTSVQKDLLWEYLGFSGRMVVANQFMTHCTGADAELLGKSLGAAEVG